jgi:predicted Zn-dependent protease
MKVSKAKRYLLPLVICSVMLTRCGCDFFGTTGALLISQQDEADLGKEFDTQLRTKDTLGEYPIYVADTPDKQAFDTYVKDLAREVLSKVPEKDRPDYDFTFTIIDKDVENAFAVPGGYVYIYTGIVSKMKNEAELAGVLGHEIAHVTQHHYRDALAKDAAFSLLLQVLLGNDAGQLTKLVAQNFAGLTQMKVSQSNESEADFYGTKYLASTNRNPLGIATFFARFPGGGGPLAWFSTHPAPESRVEDVTKEVNDSPALKALAADSTLNYASRFEINTKVIPKK